MRTTASLLFEWFCKSVCVVLLLKFLLLDLPIITGWAIVDRMDPSRPGRMTAIVITPMEWLGELFLIAMSFFLARFLVKRRGLVDGHD